MVETIGLLLGGILRLFRARHKLLLENLALRQQLSALKRKHPRPRLTAFDKLFWVLARRLWSGWKQALVIVTPETREVLKYPPKQNAYPDCGGKLNFLGEDISEILQYVPARFKVIRQVRPKLACACCGRIVQAEAPSRPIERGVAGPGLLAHVLASKYCDHLPLYRQLEMYAREGVELERSTLADCERPS
jgi:transposase